MLATLIPLLTLYYFIYIIIYMKSSISKSSLKVAQASGDIIYNEKTDKIGLFIKLDRSVVAWFKASGPGYQRKMNEVLKRFVSAVNSQNDSTEKPSILERAQELFEKYYEQCFWHMKPDLIVTEVDLPQIIKGLKTYGGRTGYIEAAELCR